MKTPSMVGDRIRQYLEQGKRFDNRKPDEFRELTIEPGVSKNAEASVRVKLGETEVLVGIKMNVSTPYPDSPDKGNLMVTAELLPLSSSRYEKGPPKFPAIELGRLTDRLIRESKVIDFKKLCIKEGEKVWTVFVDVYSINDAGNVLDAAGIGAMIALKMTRMPKYDEENEKVLFGELTDQKIPLAKDVPLSVTVHRIGKHFIVDPTVEEEDISEARLTIGSTGGIIFSMQKGNEKALTIEEFKEALNLVEKVEKELSLKLNKYLK